jgi:PAS domain S-box-containing protein
MTSRQRRVQTLYEISLAIEQGQTLERTADGALSAYMQKLNCSVGAVFRTVSTGSRVEVSVTSSIPVTPERNELFRAGRECLVEVVRTNAPPSKPLSLGWTDGERPLRAATDGTQSTPSFGGSLPLSGQVGQTSHYYLLRLPEFGVLLLGKRDGSLGSETVSALTPLNEKLAQACRSKLTEARLRTQRDRFEAIFEAIPEPIVHATAEKPARILDTNAAFEEVFGHPEETEEGRLRGPPVAPDVDPADVTGAIGTLNDGEVYTHEVERRTGSSEKHFLYNAVPTGDAGATEYFGIYVDITAQRARERTLEELHVAIQALFDEESRREVCARATDAAESILGESRVGVYLYDRDAEALDPVATSGCPLDRVDRLTERDDPVRKAYGNRRTVRVTDPESLVGTLPSAGTPVDDAVLLSLGSHGVVFAAVPAPRSIDDEDMSLLELLGQSVETALTRSATEVGLRTVQETVREALGAATHEEMAATVLDRIPGELDLPLVGIWKHRPATRTLEPLGQTDEVDALVGSQPTFRAHDSVAWEVFETNSTRIVSDVSQHPSRYNPDTPIEGEITVPIGDFGVLIAASTRAGSFTRFDAEILEVLAANLEVLASVIETREDTRLLDQVIARVLRHNVRNQLTPIKGYADMIGEESDGRIETYAERIAESGDELEKTAEHAREMRSIVRNRNRMTTLSLEGEVREAAATVGAEFPEGDLVLNVEHTAEVTAHPELGAAVRHLVRNGFEHDPSTDPRVEVTVARGRLGPKIEVADDGPGIDAYELEVLNEHDESALKHGSGAGLWIVDRVIEYSDALLEFERTDGTRATITFPAGAPGADPSSDSA